MDDTMELWVKVCETDPDVTKKVNQKGGFTSVCAQSQIKKATELWGPYGFKWGVENIVFGVIVDATGNPLEITIQADFYYPIDANQHSFPIGSDAAFRAGNDSRKKLLTDITTKALSKLGFNSDVFEGLYDDNKYVQDLRDKKNSNPPKQDKKPDLKPDNEKPKPTPKSEFWGYMLARAEEQGAKLPNVTDAHDKPLPAGIAIIEACINDMGSDMKTKDICDNMDDLTFPLTSKLDADSKGWGVLSSVVSSFDLKKAVNANIYKLSIKNKGQDGYKEKNNDPSIADQETWMKQ